MNVIRFQQAKRAGLLAALASLVACGDSAADPDAAVEPDMNRGTTDLGALDLSTSDASSPDAGADPEAWRLPEAHRVGRKLELHGLYPRPDDETASGAYHRLAHPNVPYRVRVGVQGGEWPFRYELVDGPAGATMLAGELARVEDPGTGATLHVASEGYGVVDWAAPTEGTHDFRVRVTDQTGESIELTWTTTTDPESFVFVDAEAGDDGASGTFGAPLRTFAEGLWRTDDSDASFAGRVAVFRTGTYSVYASEPGTSPVLDGRTKPTAFVAMPGEEVTFDLSEGHFRTARRGGMDDFLAAQIHFEGSRSDLGNNRLFNVTDRAHRVTFWGVSFDSSTVGNVGTDNPACVAFMSDGPHHENLAILDSELRAGAAAQLVVTFDARYVLFEGNRAVDVAIGPSNGNQFLHAKDDTNDLTIRDNVFIGASAGSPISVTNQITLGSAANQEVCWNRVVYEGDMNVDAAIAWNGQSTTPDADNAHHYRNSATSSARAFRFSGASEPIPVTWEGNLYHGDYQGVFGSNRVAGDAPNVELTADDFDAEGRLVGEARASHLGYGGAELAVR